MVDYSFVSHVENRPFMYYGKTCWGIFLSAASLVSLGWARCPHKLCTLVA